jgi:ADP-ribosylglycohydrolase
MRVSPVGLAFDTEDEVLSEAEKTANISHNHPEGVKGAQATALAVFLARMGHTKEEI